MNARLPIRVHLLVALLAVAPFTLLTAGPAAAADKPCVTTSGLPVNTFSAAPDKTKAPVGSPHSISATVGVDSSDASGICVRFSQNSGPSNAGGWPRYRVTNGSGNVGITWTSAATGTDSILAVALDGNGKPVSRAIVNHTWTAKPKPPPPPPTRTPSPTPSPPPPPPTTSPTASPTPSPTASPTASATPTATATVSPTASPTASPTPVPTASGFDDGSIQLDQPSAVPGGTATLSGRNCLPRSAVTFSVEGTPAGSTTAHPDGTFGGDVQLPDAAIGEHLIAVSCAGRTATVPIDLVVSSSISTPATGATAAAVLVFFVLLGSVLFSRTNPTPKLKPPDPDELP